MNQGKQYLFRFGFESPDEHRHNRVDGTDFESSYAMWISAPSANDALVRGRAVAEQLVTRLFERSDAPDYSWLAAGFAHWIEEDDSVLAWARGRPEVPIVENGSALDVEVIVAALARKH